MFASPLPKAPAGRFIARPLSASAFNPIGFEGAANNIPYATNVGIPTGTPLNTPFTYNFVAGNNLQSFRNATAGIVDTDDLGSTGSVPDYYKSPEFGWRLDGWRTTDVTTPGWNSFNPSFVGGGSGAGEDYPGSPAGRNTELSEAININNGYSTTSLLAAPGLGSQFLDTHGSSNVSAQLSFNFEVSAAETFFITMAFGGRDANSQNFKTYFRLLNGATVVFAGDTGAVPLEAWSGMTPTTPVANAGVTQTHWEYFKNTFAVVPNTTYTLQVLLSEEVNFDFALGGNYSYTPGLLTVTPVPEPSAALFGVFGLLALARRRRQAC